MSRSRVPPLLMAAALTAVALVTSSRVHRGPIATEPAVAALPGPDGVPVGVAEWSDPEVRVDGHRLLRLPLESVFVLPGESIDVDVGGEPAEEVAVQADAGLLTRVSDARWNWTPPPAPGHADLWVAGPDGTEFTLRAWTLVPRTDIEDGRLGDFRVGRYPATPLGGNPIYLPPPGLVRVTEENRDVLVSPHFAIGHFVSKQSGGHPKYLILRPELLLKLELLLEALVDRGHPVESFHVMSGYRTPFYNVQVLGNVQYSRHQWGGAADIFVDERPKNGVMDDLDGDGQVGLSDIAVITELVDSLERELDGFPIGGAGVYKANAVRGPFVHIDVRGVPARW